MKAIIEGLLFVSGEDGLSLDELTKITGRNESEIKEGIKELYNDYKSDEHGIQIEYLGEHFKLTTKQEHKEYYKKLVEEESSTLSQSALETLAIIAYNEPVTRMEVDEIRGINSSYVIRKLLIKGLIEEAGKKDAPGNPKLFKTTDKFLDYFGLGSVKELPKIEKEEKILDEEDLFEAKYKE